MKKVKLMLLSFCVLAIVAGALAFKSKGNLKFCYAAVETSSPFCGTEQSPKACPNYTSRGASGSTFLCTTPTTGNIGSECSNVNCSTISVQTTTTE